MIRYENHLLSSKSIYMNKSTILRNQIQLITYADSLGKNFHELAIALDTHFKGVVSGVHVLPFYPSSSDRGFSPLTHFEVDPVFGTWADVQLITAQHDFMSDVVLNHVSKQSIWFQDYLAKGDASEYADYFITAEKFSHRIKKHRDQLPEAVRTVEKIVSKIRAADKLFHLGGVSKAVLKKIYRPRPGTPFVEMEFKDGTKKQIWCTFSNDQIDVDINNPKVRQYFKDVLVFLAEKGIKLVRLDAFGYAAKERDTNNFLIPQAYAFVDELAQVAHAHGMAILPEVHNHYSFQIKLAQTPGVDYVYDFALPLLIMNALFTKNKGNLKHWIDIRPQNCVTTLDTHDGLPVPDVEDLMPEAERQLVCETIRKNGGKDALRASGTNSDNLDVYQINCTYYSALGESDDAYIMARALQYFVPGIPQVYYVGLLAGKNDPERLDRTGVGREINRHAYSLEEIALEMQRPVVKRLFQLSLFRNTYAALNGEFCVKDSPEHQMILGWKNDSAECELKVDFQTLISTLEYTDTSTGRPVSLIL